MIITEIKSLLFFFTSNLSTLVYGSQSTDDKIQSQTSDGRIGVCFP